MSSMETIERIKKIVADELGITTTEVASDLGLYTHPRWDSLAHAAILVQLERQFGLVLDDDIFDNVTTFQKIADKVGVKS